VVAAAAVASTAKITSLRPNVWISQHRLIMPTSTPPGIRIPARLSSPAVERLRGVRCVPPPPAAAADACGCADADGTAVPVVPGGCMS
jgi:hypothetical protein